MSLESRTFCAEAESARRGRNNKTRVRQTPQRGTKGEEEPLASQSPYCTKDFSKIR